MQSKQQIFLHSLSNFQQLQKQVSGDECLPQRSTHVIPSSNGMVSVTSSYFSQPRLRVIPLIIESCGQLIYQGLILAVL